MAGSSNITSPTAVPSATAPTYTASNPSFLSVDLSGNLRTIDGSSGVAGVAGIPSTARLLSAAADTNATVVKDGTGRVFQIAGICAVGAARYLKLYNKATTPSEADTPRMTLGLPASSAFAFDFYDVGLGFSAGISYRIVTEVADASTAACSAGDIVALNISYA